MTSKTIPISSFDLESIEGTASTARLAIASLLVACERGSGTHDLLRDQVTDALEALGLLQEFEFKSRQLQREAAE